MRILRDRRQMKAITHEWRYRQRQMLALVPTMGNLHEGHLALVRHARERSERVCVSIFVNPLQFDQAEDLHNYPRTLEADTRQLAEMGVDALFCPDTDELLPSALGVQARVSVPELGTVLEGAHRPGHFDGVATIVAKLLHLVQPDLAVFGEKDFQQLRIIEAMVDSLDFPVNIESVATVRASDGLALSSRNARLSQEARALAPVLYRSLVEVAQQGQVAGESGPSAILRVIPEAQDRLRSLGFAVDYLSLRRTQDLREPDPEDTDLILLLAAWIDGVRLIDNLRLRLPTPAATPAGPLVTHP
jgi:pantoate--beta-alanine ligase